MTPSPAPELHLTREDLRTFDHPALRLMAGELRQGEVLSVPAVVLNLAHVAGLRSTVTFHKSEAGTPEAARLALYCTLHRDPSQAFLALVYLSVNGSDPEFRAAVTAFTRRAMP